VTGSLSLLRRLVVRARGLGGGGGSRRRVAAQGGRVAAVRWARGRGCGERRASSVVVAWQQGLI
jgi:hypothetical protein